MYTVRNGMTNSSFFAVNTIADTFGIGKRADPGIIPMGLLARCTMCSRCSSGAGQIHVSSELSCVVFHLCPPTRGVHPEQERHSRYL